MKVRKLAVALALAGGLGSGVAQALGLGEIELQSYLNEPLDADINLRKSEGVSPGDVFVNIAPQSAFERVGIDRSFFLTKLDFDVTTAPDGSLVVNVSSREPLREPYLNFLLEVTWPNGRLMREYAVLVDPPVYAEESGVEEQVSAPATTTAQPAEPRVRQQTQTQSRQDTRQSGSSGSRTLGPTNSADTLWTIAAQVRPNSDVSMQQVMLALQDLNPDAFIAGNINRLKRGEILRIPDENQIRSRSRAEANREVAAQNQSFNSPQRTVDATGQSADGQSEQVSGSNGGDQLRLLAADDSGQRDADEGGSAGGDGDTAGGVDAGSAVAMEELESARRENEELSGRVDDLQDQVETLQRLLELKNSQLAEVQGAQGESPDMNGEPVAPADEASAEAGEDGEPSAQTEEEPSAENGEPSAESEEPSAETEESSVESEELPAETEAEEPSSDMADVSDAAPAEAATEEESAAQQPEAAEPVAAEESAPPQKPFPGNIIDAISNNFMYQIALGGGLIVLLLLLLLLARRNANREKAFYDQLNNDGQGEEGDSFDLTFDEEEGAVDPEDDAIAEADAYIAYGRNDQAAQTLETAISREPSRTDLRLKLLGLYADIQDRESFDKQFREIEALDDEAATAEAQNLQSRLEESESMPSIDDLESQLRSSGVEDDVDADKGSAEEAMSFESDYTDYETDADDRLPEDDEPDFGDLDLDEADTTSSLDDLETEKAGDSEATDRDGLIEYDLSELETEEESDLEDLADKPDSKESDELEEGFDFSLEEGDLSDADLPEENPTEITVPGPVTDDEDDLSLDFDVSELEDDQVEETGSATSANVVEDDSDEIADDRTDKESAELDIGDDGELDESFLDELDAELDKVAGEDDVTGDEAESDLDDLELDVSDEDLALMEEFSETDVDGPADAPEKAEDDELSLDDELGLEDTLSGEEPADPEQELEGAEQLDENLADSHSDDVAPPVASDPTSSRDSGRDIDESDLGDDDDFDFLSGTDEAATKLDLARAYVEMGDVDGARDILEEVALEGNEEQKAEAQDLLKNLS